MKTEGRLGRRMFSGLASTESPLSFADRGLPGGVFGMTGTDHSPSVFQCVKDLDERKPVIICGDLNVAHQEIDLKNPKTNRKNPGFTDQEREKFTNLLAVGFTDTFRHFYPDQADIYSWWSYRFKAREKNTGWRIDYFVASAALTPRLHDAKIHTDSYGSDHCPIELTLT